MYRSVFITSLLLLSSLFASQSGAVDLSNQVVTIFVTKQNIDHFTPWNQKPIKKETIGGCVIKNNMILTSTYSIADSVILHVSKNGALKKYQADIVVRDYQTGLALLSVRDKSFFNNMEPAVLARQQSLIDKKAHLYTWDSLGNFREYSADVLNMKVRFYKPSSAVLVFDMSTNLEVGGYGEPIYLNKKLVGISTGFDKASKKVYVLSAHVLSRMLDDLKNGTYNGGPFFWINDFPLKGKENLRKYLGLKESETGIFINNIHPLSSGKDILKKGDIILKINNTQIDDKGIYKSKFYSKLNYYGLIHLNHSVGDIISMDIIRDKKRIKKTFPLVPIQMEKFPIPIIAYDTQPEYLVYGGLVFQNLSIGYLKTWGSNWTKEANKRMLFYYDKYLMDRRYIGKRIIILNRVLAASVNSGFQGMENVILSRVNGKSIKNLGEMKTILDLTKKRFVKFDFIGSGSIVLDNGLVRKSAKEIKKQYRLHRTYYINRNK